MQGYPTGPSGPETLLTPRAPAVVAACARLSSGNRPCGGESERVISRALNALRWRWRCRQAVTRARLGTDASLSRVGIQRVLVVCYGNIYRSPLVAEALRRRCAGRIEFRSSGFHPRGGRHCPERHVAMCADRGIDLSGHRSSVVQPADVAWADLVVVMDRHNWQALQRIGARDDRIAWLGVLDGGPIEIPDPYALDDESARRVLARLEDCAARLADRLVGPAVDDAAG